MNSGLQKLKPHLHHRFLAHHHALQEDAPTPATASTTVQPKSSAPKAGLRRKKSRFWRLVYAVLGLQDLERTPRCYNILGKNCLPLVCSYCGKYIYRFSHDGHCDLAISSYSSRRFFPQATYETIGFWYTYTSKVNVHTYISRVDAPRVHLIGWRAYIPQVDAPTSQRRTYTLQLNGLLQQQRGARLPKSRIQAPNDGNSLLPIYALSIYMSQVRMLYWRQMPILGASNMMSRTREFLIKSHFRSPIVSLGSPSQRLSDGRIVPSLMAGPVSLRTAHYISWLQRPIAASTLSRKPLIHMPGIYATIAGSGAIPSSRPRTVVGL